MLALSNTEIIIALIGSSGTVIVAVLSNLDKILPGRGKIKESFSGYTPTDEFSVEYRYFIEVTDARRNFEILQNNIIDMMFKEIESQADDDENIEQYKNIVREESIGIDEMINEILPIAEKYYTISQIQELNKFYSTKPMREMMKKTPHMTAEINPKILQLAEVAKKRIYDRISSV